MDAKSTGVPGQMILEISLSEAKDIGHFVDTFKDWQLIADRENAEPMMFMLRFGSDCKSAARMQATYNYPIASGRVLMKPAEIIILSYFIKSYCDVNSHIISFMQRILWNMTWKTIYKRVKIHERDCL